MWTPLTQALVAELKKLQVSSVTTDKKEMIVRCPICGDSKKHTNSAHLYIKLDIDEDSLHTYYCQKCKSKGAVDSSFLKLLDNGFIANPLSDNLPANELPINPE